MCVCIISPPQYLRSGSSVYLERLRYLWTVLSRSFRIWTTTEPNKARAKNIAQAMVWQIFGLHTMTCLVSKSTYLTWTIWWWPQISQMKQSLTKLNQTKTWNKAITMALDNYLWTYCDMLGIKNMHMSLGIQWLPYKQFDPTPYETKQTKNMAQTMILANFWFTTICWISKSSL